MLRVYAKPVVEAAELIGQLKLAIAFNAKNESANSLDVGGKDTLLANLMC